jgi:microcompartment protein CcmK/EutM
VKIGRVVGTVVSTINSPVFDGRKLLLCDLLGTDGKASGGYLIAVDAIDAGAGEVVLILDEGNGARQIVGQDPAPIRAMVVGVVDEMMVDGDAVITAGT